MITFTVWGKPQTQGSFAAAISKSTKKPILIQSNKTEWSRWRKAVNAAAVAAWGQQDPTDEPLQAFIDFYFGPTPKSHQGDIYCDTMGDADKLVRAVFDGCTQFVKHGDVTQRGITVNDSRFVMHQATKYWCDAEDQQRAVVRIEALSRTLYQETTTLGL